MNEQEQGKHKKSEKLYEWKVCLFLEKSIPKSRDMQQISFKQESLLACCFKNDIRNKEMICYC